MTPVCAVCHYGASTKPACWHESRPFNRTCGSRKCVAKLRKYPGGMPAYATEARKRSANVRLQAVIGWQFGALSDRERELFKVIWKTAYMRGYGKGVHLAKRRKGAV
jgi:hypothetical protein